MYIDPRHNKNGTVTYRVTHYDNKGKRRRLPVSEYPKFKSKAEAEEWLKSQKAYQAAKTALMQQKNSWRTKYTDFQKLEKAFPK